MISPEGIIGIGITWAGVVGHFFVAGYRINQNAKEIEQIWSWKNGHERDVNNVRERYQTQLAELKGGQLVVGEQFRQIMGMLEDIRKRLTDLENHKNGRSS